MSDFVTWDELGRATGAGVRVLVVDSGVESDHRAFHGRELATWCVQRKGAGFDVVQDRGGDAFGHGTAVADIILRHAPGVALESLRVLDEDASGSSERVLAGLRWAVQRGYDVVNCSLGTGETRWTAPYKYVVDMAYCRNVLLVGACSNMGFRETSLPSSFPSVVGTDRGSLEPLRITRRRGELVEFVAHGVDVVAAWKGGGTRTLTGTSFAAPHMAALLARLRELRPDWNVCDVKAQLNRLCAEDVTSSERSVRA